MKRMHGALLVLILLNSCYLISGEYLNIFLVKLVLIGATVFILQGCSLFYYGRVNAPSASYWSKDGYSLESTSRFLYEVCDYDAAYDKENSRLAIIKTDECMLENGFSFMEDYYDVVSLGYLPLKKDMCTRRKNSFLYNTPGCQSYREKHPERGMWLKRLFTDILICPDTWLG